MSNSVLVSVIITAYNSRSYIGRAVNSAIAQTYPQLEVVVIDDGSSDDTAAIVKREFPQAHLVSQENQGVAGARNAGLVVAKGDWIAYLDSDDYWDPQKIEKQLKFAIRHPGVRFITCNSYVVRDGDNIGRLSDGRRVLGSNVEEGIISRYFTGRARYAFHNSSVLLIRQDIFDDYGVFDTNYDGNEDSEFVMRIALYGEPIGYINEALSYYEVANPQSVTKRYVRHSTQFIDYWMTAESRYRDCKPENNELFLRTRYYTIYNSPMKVLLKTGNGLAARRLLRKYEVELAGWRWYACYGLSFIPLHLLWKAKRAARRVFRARSRERSVA